MSDSHRACVWKLRETYGNVVRDIQVFSELERDVDGLAALKEGSRCKSHLDEPAKVVENELPRLAKQPISRS